MTKRRHLLIAAFIAATVASPAGAVWKSGNDLYDTLTECFAHHDSCRWVGKLVPVTDAASLAKANAALRTARYAPEAAPLYYFVQRDGAAVRSRARSGGSVGPVFVTGCLTAGGDVHKPKCGEHDVMISVQK